MGDCGDDRKKRPSSPRATDWSFHAAPCDVIVAFDLETTPIVSGLPDEILEFAAIVLDKRSLKEQEVYSTLIKGTVTDRSTRINHITRADVANAPVFASVADKIFDILDGRVWLGHNIDRFDRPMIAKAFCAIGREPPSCVCSVDTLPLLRDAFGQRAGNMKMATLGLYFELGIEEHRALSDVRMTIKVLQNCATIILMERYCSGDEPPALPSPPPPRKRRAGAQRRCDRGSGRSSDADDASLMRRTMKLAAAIDEARAGNASVWISYGGGTRGPAPRRISPVGWVSKPAVFEASTDEGVRHFATVRILDLRSDEWTV